MHRQPHNRKALQKVFGGSEPKLIGFAAKVLHLCNKPGIANSVALLHVQLCALLKHVSFCAYCFVAPSFTSQMVYVLQQHMCSACFPCWVPDNKSQFVPMCSACPTCCISRHCRCRQAMCSYTALVCVFSSGALFTCLHVTDDCMQKKPRTEQ